VAESWPDVEAVTGKAAFFVAQADGPRRVLLLGGLGGGLAAELLRYPVERVTVIEPDAAALERTRPFLDAATRAALDDPRLDLRVRDPRDFVNGIGAEAALDLVLVTGVDPSTAHANRLFTREAYGHLARALAPRGVLCTAVSAASNYLGREVQSYAGAVFRTLAEVFPEVAVVPGDTYVFCAGGAPGLVTTDPEVLEARYRALPLAGDRLPAGSFANLVEPRHVALARERLVAEAAEVNRDERPVAYYLNMLLWGKLSASGFVTWVEGLRRLGPWPYLVPVAVVALLLPLRAALEGPGEARSARQGAVLALAGVGFAAMAGQLALIYGYQAHVGFVFSRIALLNAVFMTGLALGAGAFGAALARGARPELRLAGVGAALAVGLALLALAIVPLGHLPAGRQEAAYLALSGALGLFTGTAYPLGVALAHRESRGVLPASSVAQTADHLGGALGGFLAGSLMVPLLGTPGTLRVLAGVTLVCVLPVALAVPAARGGAALRVRGHRAFPWPALSWGLIAAVLSGGVLFALDRRGDPPPPLYFGEEVLAGVSGSGRFALREAPFPHYLGDPGPPGVAGEGARTVTLASGAVAREVRGHGGPLDLLVAVDEEGRLRGVRHLASRETPAYVEGIEAWLAGLTGYDLAAAPLDLERYDGLSGATVTSRAALETVARTADAGARAAFGLTLAERAEGAAPAWWSPGLVAVALLLVAFVPVYRSGRDGPRLAYQAAALAVLGLWLNTLPTEMDLASATLGRWPGLAGALPWYLLAGFVIVTGVLLGQAYCGYVCPFGALQELLSRLGRRLGLRRYASRGLDTGLRQLKFVLLAAVLLAVWVTGDPRWAGFNPMQHLFGGHLTGAMLVITAASLAGAVVYYRFWCRYLCPFGALVALFNKVALLRGFGPRRRFDHCDLGVRDEFDVDCIRCHRCVTGRDFGVGPAHGGSRPRPGL
jgi:hypothetical protein